MDAVVITFSNPCVAYPVIVHNTFREEYKYWLRYFFHVGLVGVASIIFPVRHPSINMISFGPSDIVIDNICYAVISCSASTWVSDHPPVSNHSNRIL